MNCPLVFHFSGWSALFAALLGCLRGSIDQVCGIELWQCIKWRIGAHYSFLQFHCGKSLILNNFLVSSGKHGLWKNARYGWHAHAFASFSVIGTAHCNCHSQNTCNNILPMLMVLFGNTSLSFAAWYWPLDHFRVFYCVDMMTNLVSISARFFEKALRLFVVRRFSKQSSVWWSIGESLISTNRVFHKLPVLLQTTFLIFQWECIYIDDGICIVWCEYIHLYLGRIWVYSHSHCLCFACSAYAYYYEPAWWCVQCWLGGGNY